MLRWLLFLSPLLLVASGPTQIAPGITFIAGRTDGPRQPDGNSVFIAAPDGWILVDTGRHRAHQDQLIAFARASGRPVAAIVNTHWHLDHSGGNAEIRAVWPDAKLFTSRAVEGALAGFLADSRRDAEAYVASGKADAATVAEIAGDVAAIEDRAALIPDVAVTRSGRMRIAGRMFDVHLAEDAATEGDVWLFDRATRTLIAGDLVVAHLPFFDTGCPEGWRRALDRIAAQRFDRLIPGHGAPMSRADFLVWRRAFNGLLDCAASSASDARCIAGWLAGARQFLPADTKSVERGLAYYLKHHLRARSARHKSTCTKAA
jgi:glyoxylase-like metal-dependent hydrolase (beta-lactamase superfamily II)